MHSNPYLTKPRNPNYLRRAMHHDYTRPGKYMLTLSKAQTTPVLSVIEGEPEAPLLRLTASGECIVAALERWQEKYSQIVVAEHVIMPDHIHLCVDVRAYLPQGLSRAVAWMMGAATRESSLRSDHGQDAPFFSKGFNDRIAYTEDQWLRQIKYTHDNPRRLLMKRLHPDLFYRRCRVVINSQEYCAVGNIFLLDNPELCVVRFSRRYTASELELHQQQWHRCVENGGVLVSPFIHPQERDMLNEASDAGGSMIEIRREGFPERYAPQGREFEEMTQGRLLIIGAPSYDTQTQPLTYAGSVSLSVSEAS